MAEPTYNVKAPFLINVTKKRTKSKKYTQKMSTAEARRRIQELQNQKAREEQAFKDATERRNNTVVTSDNRGSWLKYRDSKVGLLFRQNLEYKQNEEAFGKLVNGALNMSLPNRYIGLAANAITGNPQFGFELGMGNSGVNLALDLLIPLTRAGYPKSIINSKLNPRDIPPEVSQYTYSWKRILDKLNPQTGHKIRSGEELVKLGNFRKDYAMNYYNSDEFVRRALNAGFNEKEISLLQNELKDMLNNVTVKTSLSVGKGLNGWADAYLKNGDIYRNITVFEPNLKGDSLEDLIALFDHELGHAATNAYSSDGTYLLEYLNLVENRYPMIVRAMKYNESIFPKFSKRIQEHSQYWNDPDIFNKIKTRYPEMTENEVNEFIGKQQKLIKSFTDYVGNSNETRSRAIASLFAALRKGIPASEYVSNSSNISNARYLAETYEPESLKKYLDNFLNYASPIGTLTYGTTRITNNK